jgi:hypothetical protein
VLYGYDKYDHPSFAQAKKIDKRIHNFKIRGMKRDQQESMNRSANKIGPN